MVNVVYKSNYDLNYDFNQNDNLYFYIKDKQLHFTKYQNLTYPVLFSIVNFIKYSHSIFKNIVIIEDIISHQNTNHFLIKIKEYDNFPS